MVEISESYIENREERLQPKTKNQSTSLYTFTIRIVVVEDCTCTHETTGAVNRLVQLSAELLLPQVNPWVIGEYHHITTAL
jgi:hypothetical protein